MKCNCERMNCLSQHQEILVGIIKMMEQSQQETFASKIDLLHNVDRA